MHRLESMLTAGRQILSFDPSGDGRAAEVFGDLTKARRVSVVVPGVDTNLSTFERTARANTGARRHGAAPSTPPSGRRPRRPVLP